MIDWGQYIGIPYKYGSYDREKGLFCWSLARLVMAEQFGVELPKAPHSARNRARDGMTRGIVDFLDYEEVALAEARCGDVAQMLTMHKGKWLPVHVGVFVDPHNILHLEDTSRTSHIFNWRRGNMECKIVKVCRPCR